MKDDLQRYTRVINEAGIKAERGSHAVPAAPRVHANLDPAAFTEHLSATANYIP